MVGSAWWAVGASSGLWLANYFPSVLDAVGWVFRYDLDCVAGDIKPLLYHTKM